MFREKIKRMEGKGIKFDICVKKKKIGKEIEIEDMEKEIWLIVENWGEKEIKEGEIEGWREGMDEI